MTKASKPLPQPTRHVNNHSTKIYNPLRPPRGTYLFRPDAEQEGLLRKTARCCNYVHNRALNLYQKLKPAHQKQVSKAALEWHLRGWMRDLNNPGLSEVALGALTLTLRNIRTARKNSGGHCHSAFREPSERVKCQLPVGDGVSLNGGQVSLAKTTKPLVIDWGGHPLRANANPGYCVVCYHAGTWTIRFR